MPRPPAARTACPSDPPTAPGPTAGPATTSPAATTAANAPAARRILAVKKGHCRLCWLQAGLIAAGRRITPADFARAGRHQQLSFAGMSRLGHTSPRPAVPAAERPQPPAPAAGTQLQLPAPGQSRHFDKAHWVASSITGEALQPGQAHRRRTRRHPRLEPPDRHRDRPGAGRRPRRSHPRRPDRLVRAVTSAALPGPERHPHRRDPRPRRAPARRPGPLLHLLRAGAARAPASADGRRRRALAAHPQRGRPPQPSPQRAHRPDEPQPGPPAAAGMGRELRAPARGHHRRHHRRHRAPARQPAPADPHRPALTVRPLQENRQRSSPTPPAASAPARGP